MLSKKFTAVAGATASAAADDYFKNTTLLLSGDGTNGAQNNTFTDSSTNNYTITRSGNTTQGTFSPFAPAGGSWSNYFDGSSAYLTATNNTAYAFGTGDFCVEAWVFLTSTPSGQMVVGSTYQSSGSGFTFSIESNVLKVRMVGDPTVLSGGTTVTPNTWHHIAVTRSGTSLKVFLDGTQDGSTTNSDNVALNSTAFNIARLPNNSGFLAGYVSNLRVVKGSAVYTATFTPSTTPLTEITNTSLLTCQSNRFLDNSTNAFAITVGGSPSVQRFNPFNPTSAYSTSTVGGSGYFDGSGDYLTTSTAASLNLGASSTWTIEFWGYVGTSFGTFCPISMVQDTTNRWDIEVSASSTTLLFNNTTATTFTNPSTLSPNTWFHMAFVRDGTTVKMYINGTASSTTSTSNLSSVSTATLTYIGRNNFSGYNFDWNGYISNLRLVNGTAVYTSAFTPPTAPVTAITNTSLLLNFTNAGIYDSAMINDLETAGNAQVSTTQKKYGTASMYFDGTGDYLIMPDTLTGKFGTGDFTIEYWDYHGTQGTNYASQVGTLSSGTGAGTWRFGTFGNNTGLYFSYHNGTSFVDVTFGSGTYNDSTWRHFAISRQSGTLRAFVNGTQVGTNQTVTQDLNSSNRVVIGAELTTPTYFTGYIDDLRITKGYARYTANFTAPTAALPNY